ncbi:MULTISPECIES: ferritin [Nocardia]|uniref:Ferritin n=2 Tax=Nocardia TaxID=1817 RepID=A0A4R6P8L2_NOCIG|nr:MULTISPECIES: ferritin-like domain-containing protein [Nocardia]NKX87188.1 ferritin [Nocardia coubleae]TDP32449.1 ferritin [Nocardia ignorata]
MADFTELLRDQIRHGLTAAQQYLAAAVYFDAQRLPQLADQTYAHAARHRGHALRMVQYLLDRDVAVRVGGLDEVRPDFDAPREAIAFLLAREETITTQISALAATARAAGDYLGEQFTQWFLREQVDEVAALTTLLAVLDRDGNLFDVEEFVRRELPGTAKTYATAPKMAGEGRA